MFNFWVQVFNVVQVFGSSAQCFGSSVQFLGSSVQFFWVQVFNQSVLLVEGVRGQGVSGMLLVATDVCTVYYCAVVYSVVQ